jgi:hypothetical protein
MKERYLSIAELRALPCRNVGSGDIQIFGRQSLKAGHLSSS